MSCRVERRGESAMAEYIEGLSGSLQSFGAAGIALLAVPVLIAILARNVTLALSAGLLSFASFMLVVAPASVSGIAILSGIGSFVVALESIVARRRMLPLSKEIADLSSRLNQLESAEQRRFLLEVARASKRKGGRKGQPTPSSAPTDRNLVGVSTHHATEIL